MKSRVSEAFSMTSKARRRESDSVCREAGVPGDLSVMSKLLLACGLGAAVNSSF